MQLFSFYRSGQHLASQRKPAMHYRLEFKRSYSITRRSSMWSTVAAGVTSASSWSETGSVLSGAGALSRCREGARLIDAQGAYVIPGLWDMHFHQWRYSEATDRQLIANGVTGIRDAGSDPPLDTLELWRREIATGRRVGPRQILSGKAIDERDGCLRDNANTDYHVCVSGPDDARHYVDSVKAAGTDMMRKPIACRFRPTSPLRRRRDGWACPSAATCPRG